MAVLPQSDISMIEWFEARVATWATNAAAIGLTPAQTTELLSRTGSARAAYQSAQQARSQSKAATVDFHNGSNSLRSFGADLIKTIKAYAAATDDPEVYVLSEVPPPAEPTPLGPPGQPTDLRAALNSVGHIVLTWKSANSAPSTGAYFEIQRRLDGEQAFTLRGGVSNREFTDNTVPLGTTQATYVITPFRNDIAGEPGQQFTVQFGVSIPQPGEGEGGLSLAA